MHIEEEDKRELLSKWFFKSVLNMQTNFATFDHAQEGRILFVGETGFIFDELKYPNNQIAEQKLRKNGFKRCDEDEIFDNHFSVPESIISNERSIKPVYSSGKYWID